MEKETPYAKRIRAALAFRNRRRADVARAIGISHTALSNIVSGRTRSPKAEIIRNLANELGVSVEFLMGESDQITVRKQMR